MEKLEKASDEQRESTEADMQDWKRWVETTQSLAKVEKEIQELSSSVIPDLEKKLANERTRFSKLRDAADTVSLVTDILSFRFLLSVYILLLGN